MPFSHLMRSLVRDPSAVCTAFVCCHPFIHRQQSIQFNRASAANEGLHAPMTLGRSIYFRCARFDSVTDIRAKQRSQISLTQMKCVDERSATHNASRGEWEKG